MEPLVQNDLLTQRSLESKHVVTLANPVSRLRSLVLLDELVVFVNEQTFKVHGNVLLLENLIKFGLSDDPVPVVVALALQDRVLFGLDVANYEAERIADHYVLPIHAQVHILRKVNEGELQVGQQAVVNVVHHHFFDYARVGLALPTHISCDIDIVFVGLERSIEAEEVDLRAGLEVAGRVVDVVEDVLLQVGRVHEDIVSVADDQVQELLR